VFHLVGLRGPGVGPQPWEDMPAKAPQHRGQGPQLPGQQGLAQLLQDRPQGIQEQKALQHPGVADPTPEEGDLQLPAQLQHRLRLPQQAEAILGRVPPPGRLFAGRVHPAPDGALGHPQALGDGGVSVLAGDVPGHRQVARAGGIARPR
jgi:hypothetical protein